MAVLLDILAAGVVDADGDPLASGRVYVYQVGTTTKATVYSDADLTAPTSNPLTLDAAGRAEVYTAASCRLVIEDSTGTQIADVEVVGSASTTDTTVVAPVVAGQLPPIGSVIPFYDFDGDLTFDTNYWVYCNGQSKTIGGTARTTPDLSNRYLVGFGTEGGGNIGTAMWSTTVLGNASHQVNLAHTHTVPAHGHRLPDTTTGSNTGRQDLSTASAGSFGTFSFAAGALGLYTEGYGANGGVNGSAEMTSGSGGSATQDIMPRSVACRFLMRAA